MLAVKIILEAWGLELDRIFQRKVINALKNVQRVNHWYKMMNVLETSLPVAR